MSCKEVCEFIDSYVDKELDVISSSHFEQHLRECAACRTKFEQYAEMHNAVRVHMEYFQPPEGLEQRLRAMVYPLNRAENRPAPRAWLPHWRAWALAAAIIAVVVSSVVFVQTAQRRSASEMVAHEVVSSHIRSLLANHLSDVVSTDQHTVKPWFTGKLDFAPVVKDLSSNGFPLIGGRLDYIDGQEVAALVYKRRQHTINLFLWPSQASDSHPRSLTIRGYNLVHWTQAHMTYWAVSDVNIGDLSEFAKDLGS